MTRATTGGVVVVIGWMALCAPIWAASRMAAEGGADVTDAALGRYGLYPVIEKLARGAANFLGGWLEVPLGIHKRYSKDDAVTSMFAGFATGVVKGFVRTAVGLYELVTFPVPYPEDYAPILPTLEYLKHRDQREPLPLE